MKEILEIRNGKIACINEISKNEAKNKLRNLKNRKKFLNDEKDKIDIQITEYEAKIQELD